MQQIEPLIKGRFYHIYNRGINSCDLFCKYNNYEHFLALYNKYVSPFADTFAWVLMPNHFHLFVQIKEKPDFVLPGSPSPDRVPNPVRAGDPSQIFSNLFNAYAQAFNKRFDRHGNLFERPFKRKLVDDESYFKSLVIYIHNNPVHHGFTQHSMDYPWSSYLTCISVKPTHLQRDTVINWFGGESNFIAAHNKHIDKVDLEHWLGI